MSLQTKLTALHLTSSRFTASIDRRVLNHIRKRQIIAEGEHLLAAVSGGPDSTALLLILSRLTPKLHLDITIAHFSHQLRAETEAVGDLDFVRTLAATLDLPYVHSSADVRACAHDHHLSIEDAARRLRYTFLAERTFAAAATAVALGHTLDDQAETVLLHLIRGTGLSGVSAMSPRAPWPFGEGPDLSRPLLFLRRDETERYCRESGLTPRADPTNNSLAATRNRVRHEIMPILRRLNPRIDQCLARFAQAAASDVTYLDHLAADAFDHMAVSGDSVVSLARDELCDLPRPLASRVIRLAFAQVHEINADLEATHIEALLDALHGPPGSHSLPGGITATIDQRSLILSKGSLASPAPISETPLAVHGCTSVGSGVIEASVEPPPSKSATPNRFEAYLDADKTGTALTVRSRRPGDRLRPVGLGGEKKLQDILVNAKVPVRDRNGIPLVCTGDRIAWVVGHCIDERFALDESSSRALHLTATRS